MPLKRWEDRLVTRSFTGRKIVLWPVVFLPPDLPYIQVHQVASQAAEGGLLYHAQILMMFCKELIRRFINAKIPVDAFALNISIIPVKVYYGMLKISHTDTESAKGSATIPVYVLKILKILTVYDKSLQLIPVSLT